MENPLRLIVIGFVLLLIGAVLPFLMLTGVVESTLFLNFLAAVSSIAGITTGFMGVAVYIRRRR
jgi:hypothetical protein